MNIADIIDLLDLCPDAEVVVREAVSLGRRVLRAETAAVPGAFLIAHFWDG